MPERADAPAVERGPFALRRTAAYDFIEGLNRTKEALREQGFDIATVFDARESAGGACSILGASDPDVLRRALDAHAEAGVFFPCSVAVREHSEGQEIVVTAVDPTVTLGASGNEALAAIASELRDRLATALARLPRGRR